MRGLHSRGSIRPFDPRPRGTRAGVRGVELADHLVDQIHQLLPVGDVLHDRLIFGPRASQSTPCSFGS